MSVEQLTYAALANRLKCSPEAARSLAKPLRLPRQRGNDGKALVAVDFAEIEYKSKPARSPAGHHPDTKQLVEYITALKAKITELEDEIAQLQLAASGHRADFERERERCDRLMAILMRQLAELMKATKEAVPVPRASPPTPRSRPWWRRLAG